MKSKGAMRMNSGLYQIWVDFGAILLTRNQFVTNMYDTLLFAQNVYSAKIRSPEILPTEPQLRTKFGKKDTKII